MNEYAASAWERVEGVRPIGDRLFARLFAPDVTERLLCAADSEGQRHLLILLQPQDEEFNDVQSRGLVVQTRDLVVHDGPSSRYLDFECKNPTGHPAFDLIGNDVARISWNNAPTSRHRATGPGKMATFLGAGI